MGSAGSLRKSAIPLFLVLLATLIWRFFPAGPQPLEPAEPILRFLGKVKLYQPADQPMLPRYDTGAELALLLEPRREDHLQCLPFPGGRATVTLEDPAGAEAHRVELPLEPGRVEEVPLAPYGSERRPGYLLRTLPGASFRAPYQLPDQPGLWSLRLTWRCAGESRDSSPITARFWVHRPVRVAGLEDLSRDPPARQAGRLKAALEREQDPSIRLWLLSELYYATRDASDFPAAEAVAIEWAGAAEGSELPSDQVRAWLGAHESAREQGRYRKALGYLDRATALIQRYDYQVRAAEAANSRGVLNALIGQPLEALEAFVDAQDSAQRIGRDPIRIDAQVRELLLLQKLGHLRLVNRQLPALVDARGDNPVVTNNLGWLILQGVKAGMPLGGDAATALRRAEDQFRAALESFRQKGNAANEANVLASLAEAAFLRHDPQAARARLEEAKSKVNPGARDVHLSLDWMTGNIALLESRPEEALVAFRALEDAARSQRSPQYAGNAAFGQGEALWAMGDLARAQEAYDRALSWLEEDEAASSPLHRAPLLASRAQWEARAVEVRLAQRRDSEALETVERGAWSRRRALASAAWSEQPPNEAEVKGLQAEIDALYQALLRLHRQPDSSRVRKERGDVEAQLQSRWDRLERALAGAPREAPPALKLGALAGVPRDTLLLRYALLPEALVVWEIRGDQLRRFRTPVQQSQLEQWIEQFTRSVRTGKPDAALGRRLSAALLGPWRASPPERLTVVVEGPLRSLPWAALPMGSRYLVETTSIQLLPTLHWSPGPPPASASSAMLIISDPNRNLPEAWREGQQLASRFPHAVHLARDGATRDELLRRLGDTRLLHYAGHAVTNEMHPYLSHLRLARDEQLSLMDLRRLRLRSALAFLNACGAGQVARDGGGAVGLSDGVLAAGARAVVASLWDVPDRPGALLSSTFYEQLYGGPAAGSPARALTAAQRALLRGDFGPDARSPAAWASYFLLGEADWPTYGRLGSAVVAPAKR